MPVAAQAQPHQDQDAKRRARSATRGNAARARPPLLTEGGHQGNPMKVVFAGTPEFAAVALQSLHEAGHSIPLVLTQPDRRPAAACTCSPRPSSNTRSSTA